jgi:prepilin signal peptidase PulO-like enzyme (type II secretory pathway)
VNSDSFLLQSFFFIFGLFFGSFLNVLADRLSRDESFITGRSYCEYCRHTLSFLDLIPLLSFLFLLGKCRYCKKKLSWYYPFSELMTGTLFALTIVLLPFSSMLQLFFSLFIVSCFIVIFSADFHYGIIPDKIVFPAVGISLLFYSFIYGAGIFTYIVSGIGAGLFFLALFLITKGKGMGFGDVKLALFMGIFLGFPGIVYALYIAFLTGAGVSLILILWKKKHIKSTVPFGPFLVFGTLIVFLIPHQIQQLARLVLP